MADSVNKTSSAGWGIERGPSKPGVAGSNPAGREPVPPIAGGRREDDVEIFQGISMNPHVRFGKPCLTVTRIDGATVLGLVVKICSLEVRPRRSSSLVSGRRDRFLTTTQSEQFP